MVSVTKTIHRCHHHVGWDNSIQPVVLVEPGATLKLEVIDPGGGQIDRFSSANDLTTLDFDKLNPTTGPIGIDRAEAGDALKVTLLEFEPSGFGWTGVIPGFGLLADQFPDPALHLWNYDQSCSQPAMFGDFARIPLKPFTGTIGVAPQQPGRHSVVPPRRVGGNMDIRDLSVGTSVLLPVEVPFALLSIGDTHAVQGDGEVCGSAIESAMNVVVRLDLIKQANLPSPQFRTDGPVSRHLDAKGYDVTTGIGPNLRDGARSAVAAMIDLLCREHHIAPAEAYMLCSICGDLRISEIVDVPNWVVSFYLPRIVFE